MEISEQISQLLPPSYDIDAQGIEYLRTFNEIKLPDASRTPSEYGWLWRGPVIESYFAAVDKQIYIPEQKTAVLNIKIEENNSCFGRAAYWRGKMWGYCPIGGLGPDNHPVEHNRWSWTVFQGIISARDFQCLIKLDNTCHWIHLARSG